MLQSRRAYNYNTDLFVFALASPDAPSGLPTSSCILTKCAGADGVDVIRPYTSIDQYQLGVLNLLIKVYPQGVMSKHIHGLAVGDTLDIKGNDSAEKNEMVNDDDNCYDDVSASV